VPAAALLLIALGIGLLFPRQGRGGGETVVVRFELQAPEAQDVAVVGNWNRWDPEAQKLKDPDGDGIWEIEIPLKRGEEHQYQFLIDGQNWIPDPEAPLQVKDGFGGVNSVLQI
jgi:1,4-alpha-glucan branching enzyme